MKAFLFLAVVLLMVSCSSNPSLQKYFVDKSEDASFTNIDLAPSFINTDSIQLTKEEKQALQSFKKMNVLVFKKNDSNGATYETEKDKVKLLLKDEKYSELVKYNSQGQGASITTLGEGDKIDEVVVFAYKPDTGFGVIRILSDNMTPNNVLTLVGLMQKANLNVEQLKPLQELIKK